MPTVDEDLDLSRTLLGTPEDPPGSNHNFITDWYADRVNDNGFRHAPWCAMSRSYTFDHTGGDLSYAFCPFIERDAKAGVNGLVWLAMKPEIGAWVLLDFAGNGTATHVGHVEAINDDGTIITLEGNIGDAYRREHRDFKYVRGFVRPPFDAPAPTPPAPPHPPEEDMPGPMPVIEDNNEWTFQRGTDGALWMRGYHAHKDWVSLGGIITSGPGAVGNGDGRIVVEARGDNAETWRIVVDVTKWDAGVPKVTEDWASIGGLS